MEPGGSLHQKGSGTGDLAAQFGSRMAFSCRVSQRPWKPPRPARSPDRRDPDEARDSQGTGLIQYAHRHITRFHDFLLSLNTLNVYFKVIYCAFPCTPKAELQHVDGVLSRTWLDSDAYWLTATPPGLYSK